MSVISETHSSINKHVVMNPNDASWHYLACYWFHFYHFRAVWQSSRQRTPCTTRTLEWNRLIQLQFSFLSLAKSEAPSWTTRCYCPIANIVLFTITINGRENPSSAYRWQLRWLWSVPIVAGDLCRQTSWPWCWANKVLLLCQPDFRLRRSTCEQKESRTLSTDLSSLLASWPDSTANPKWQWKKNSLRWTFTAATVHMLIICNVLSLTSGERTERKAGENPSLNILLIMPSKWDAKTNTESFVCKFCLTLTLRFAI